MGRMVKRIAVLAGVNVLVLAVLAEIVALAVFYVRTGWLFYLDPYRPAVERVAVDAGQGLTGQGLHPYFGPTHKPGIPFDMPDALKPPATAGAGAPAPRPATNNFGFVAAFDYPFAKARPEQFVVGILGGSVGAWFCQVGAPRLADDLRRHPYFASRDIVPLCLSHEGYKQPQQLLVLSYFLAIGQAFDLVVNIDGFNEVALGALNDARGFDVSMPSVMHMGPLIDLTSQATLTPRKVALLAAIRADQARLDRLAERLDRTWSAAVYVVTGQYRRYVERRVQAARVAYDALPAASGDASVIRVTPRLGARAGNARYQAIADDWSRSSLLMRDALRVRNVPYVHVLQPNQYFTRRTFTADEARVALNPGSPFKTGAEQGYPALVRAAAALARQGVTIVDATASFDREPAAVYIDDCCHYTRRGYELLADLIAARTLAGPGPWTSEAR